MTEFENNDRGEVHGESPVDPQQNPQSIIERISDITSQPDFRWRQTRLFRYAATALVITAAGVYNHFANGGEQTPVSAGTEPEFECASPTPKALAATTALFDAEPYRLSHAPAAKDHNRTITNPAPDFISLDDSTVATHYGLKLAYYYPQLENAYIDSTANYPNSIAGPAATTTDRDLTLAERYMDQFGVQLQVGSPSGEFDGLTSPTPAEKQQDLVKSLGIIAWDIHESPTAYIHLSGLKKLVLMGDPSSRTEFDWVDPHTLVWNITEPPYEGEMNQAIYEGIDSTECGFYSDDPSYAALNGRNIYGSPETRKGLLSEDHLVFQQPTKEERRLDNAIRAAYDDYKFIHADS